MKDHELLTKFKMKARAVEPTQSALLDFPFTNLQLQTLDTEEKRNQFLTSVLLTGEQMANKIFTGVDEKLILFFAAYLFVYQSPRSNFRMPDFYEFDAIDGGVPIEFTQIENDHISFGLYETAQNVKSNAAFFFCYDFAKALTGTKYILTKSQFQVEDLLAKIGSPFLLDEVETCKKFMVFDGRRTADQVRLFLFDVEAGHIEALKVKNPIGTSYEYDENFMAYGRVRGTLKVKSFNGAAAVFGDSEGHEFVMPVDSIETDSQHINEKLAACERFCFI